MTDPGLELELEQRFEAKADWSAHHALAERVEKLESWRARQDALSALRRWAVPILVTVALTGLNVGIALAHTR